MEADLTILGTALGIGLLVGLQQERGQHKIAGLRTFSLICIFGALSGLLYNRFNDSLILIVGLASVTLLIAVANFLKQKEDNPDIGQTTEIAAVLMYVIGIYLAVADLITGIVLGAFVAILLYLKKFFALRVAQLNEKDFQAIMIFVAVTLVILPVLPNNYFGPYEVLNLREIWLMVVLIVGISVFGYFAYKWLGKKTGTGLNGILGGMISSTATTVTYSKQSKDKNASFLLISFVIIAASAVSFFRVIIEIIIVAPAFTYIVVPPILIVAVFISIISLYLFIKSNKNKKDLTPDPQNPAQFKTAVVFAILYGLILVLIAYSKEYFGSGGLYAVSIISGFTDMDAITLSMANTMNNGTILPEQGWKYILVAALSNLVFKGGMMVVLGHKKLLKIVLPVFLATIAAGIIVILYW